MAIDVPGAITNKSISASDDETTIHIRQTSTGDLGSLTGIVGNAGINGYLWRSLYYDAKGRVVQERASRGFGVTDKTNYAYDYRGNVTGRRIAHTHGLNTVTTETYTYAYDGWGRPTTTDHQLNGGTAVTLSSKSYDRAGRLTGDARNGSSGLNTAYAYNVRSWLTDLSVGSSGSTFQQKLYYNEARDNAAATAYQWGGNIARMDWKTGGEERTYQFGYDLLSRLTGATYTGPGTYRDSFTRTYGYDQNGNVTSRGEKTLGNNWQLTTTSYTYDGNHLSTGTYDANGNLTAGLGYTTTYNLLNLPETVETQAGAFRYLYAADGTKLMKSVSPTGSGGPYETELQYAGNLVFRVLDLEAILVEGGYIDMTGTTPVYRFYVTDHQGNIRAVTDGTGTVLRSNHYDPYGEGVLPVLTSASTLPVSTAGTDAASRYMDGAKEWDNSVSLYDFSARWYNPASAVSFTTMDPLCEKYFSISPYAYCIGNPVRYIDPSGFTSYNINGKFRWINDGMNETISISQNEFDSIAKYYDLRDKSLYNLMRTSYMDKYGYIDAEGNSVLPVVVVEAVRSSAGFMSFSQMLGLESLLFSGAGEYHYSELFGKWRGKNGVRYDMSVNGNQYTGGKIKYARNLSQKLKKVGGVVSLLGVASDLRNVLVSNSSEQEIDASLDLVIDAIGLYPGASAIPIIWHFGGKTYYYQFVVPTIESQFESGVLGLPATQAFK